MAKLIANSRTRRSNRDANRRRIQFAKCLGAAVLVAVSITQIYESYIYSDLDVEVTDVVGGSGTVAAPVSFEAIAATIRVLSPEGQEGSMSKNENNLNPPDKLPTEQPAKETIPTAASALTPPQTDHLTADVSSGSVGGDAALALTSVATSHTDNQGSTPQGQEEPESKNENLNPPDSLPTHTSYGNLVNRQDARSMVKEHSDEDKAEAYKDKMIQDKLKKRYQQNKLKMRYQQDKLKKRYQLPREETKEPEEKKPYKEEDQAKKETPVEFLVFAGLSEAEANTVVEAAGITSMKDFRLLDDEMLKEVTKEAGLKLIPAKKFSNAVADLNQKKGSKDKKEEEAHTEKGAASTAAESKAEIDSTLAPPQTDESQPHPKPLQCSDIASMPPIQSRKVTNKCVEDHPFQQNVHSIGDIVSEAIEKGGCWEKEIIKSIVDHFGLEPNPNRTFIDIGGNIGAFTTTIANLGHPVITVEPFRLNVPLILQTLCSKPTKLENVKLFKVALSDKSPGQKMCLWSTHSQMNNGNARLVPYFEGVKDFGGDKAKSCMEVIHSYTLDELLGLSDNTQPLLAHRPWGMKMDIEGYETLALRGAQKLLLNGAPCRLWFEYQKAVTVESGAGATEIFDLLLNKAGYATIFI